MTSSLHSIDADRYRCRMYCVIGHYTKSVSESTFKIGIGPMEAYWSDVHLMQLTLENSYKASFLTTA